MYGRRVCCLPSSVARFVEMVRQHAIVTSTAPEPDPESSLLTLNTVTYDVFQRVYLITHYPIDRVPATTLSARCAPLLRLYLNLHLGWDGMGWVPVTTPTIPHTAQGVLEVVRGARSFGGYAAVRGGCQCGVPT